MASALKVVESGMDRQKALEAALAQIDRAFGKGSVMKLGQRDAMEVEAISTGSLGLDIALGIGGLPRGRVVEIYGPESSGKTTLALHAIAEAQKNGGNTNPIEDAELIIGKCRNGMTGTLKCQFKGNTVEYLF